MKYIIWKEFIYLYFFKSYNVKNIKVQIYIQNQKKEKKKRRRGRKPSEIRRIRKKQIIYTFHFKSKKFQYIRKIITNRAHEFLKYIYIFLINEFLKRLKYIAFHQKMNIQTITLHTPYSKYKLVCIYRLLALSKINERV